MTEKEKVKLEAQRLEEELNALILKCNNAKGFIYIKDTVSNDWHHRLTEPIKLTAFIPSKREDKENEI